MTQDNKFKLTITGAGISIEKDIDENQLAKILPLAVSSSINHNIIPQVSDSLSEPTLSVREYLDAKNPKTYSQKVLVVASYLKDILKKDKFTVEDVKTQFERAAEKITKNFLRDFKSTLQAGWIAESYETKGTYFLTSKGQAIIDNPDIFSIKIKNKTSKRIKNAPKQVVKIRDEIKTLEIAPVVEG